MQTPDRHPGADAGLVAAVRPPLERGSAAPPSPSPCRVTGPWTRWFPAASRTTSARSRSGGSAEPDVTWSNRIQLTLGYDPTMPDGQDIATQIRTRLEDTGGMSVRLRAVDPTADADPPDLMVLDRKAWTSTALAWLQPYLDAPLPEQRRRTSPGSSAVRGRASARRPRRRGRWRVCSARRRPTSCWCR